MRTKALTQAPRNVVVVVVVVYADVVDAISFVVVFDVVVVILAVHCGPE